jgi:hypothetical protein
MNPDPKHFCLAWHCFKIYVEERVYHTIPLRYNRKPLPGQQLLYTREHGLSDCIKLWSLLNHRHWRFLTRQTTGASFLKFSWS